MKKSEEYLSIGKFKYTEIKFNIEDVCFSIHYTHRFNSGDAIPIDDSGEIDRRSDGLLHSHPYCEMFIPIIDSFEIEFEDGMITVEKNDTVVICPSVLHTARHTEGSFAHCIIFSYSKNSLYKKGGLFDIVDAFLSDSYVLVKNTCSQINQINAFYDHLDSGRVMMASRYFFDILSELLFRSGYIPTVDPIDMLPDSDIRRQRKIEKLIDRHYTDNISLEFMASNLNLSVRQTTRLIKARCGHTLGELVTEKRMKAAIGYLEEGKLTVSEIAGRVGYNSLTCFYEAFKKYYGALPGNYKKQAKDKKNVN